MTGEGRYATLKLELRPAKGKRVALATDAGLDGKCVAMGYLCTTGHAGAHIHPYARSVTGQDRSTIAELRAVHYGLAAVLPKIGASKPVTVYTDSMAALGYLRDWMTGSVRLPASYNTRWRRGSTDQRSTLEHLIDMVAANRERLTFSHVKGHSGDPLNEGAHYMAFLAKRCGRGDLTKPEAERLARLTMETSLALYAKPQNEPVQERGRAG